MTDTALLDADTTTERPMLSRVAASLYWLGRYVERAEHVARLLLEGHGMATDVGELAPTTRDQSWGSALRIFGAEPPSGAGAPDAGRFMTLDVLNRNSISACVLRARENARGVRENISAEIWEALNSLYWSLQAAEAQMEESPQQLYTHVVISSMMFQGLTDQTLSHGQGLHFLHLGKYIERIDVACRIIEIRSERPTGLGGETSEAAARLAHWTNIHWMSLLRSCGALEGYRRMHPGELDQARVVSFLVLERSFPRSICFGVACASEAVARIRSGIAPHRVDQAERILGRLDTQLAYAETTDILREGVPAYLRKVRFAAAQAAEAMRVAYFPD